MNYDDFIVFSLVNQKVSQAKDFKARKIFLLATIFDNQNVAASKFSSFEKPIKNLYVLAYNSASNGKNNRKSNCNKMLRAAKQYSGKTGML
jgi:hypothetical protein